MGFLHDNSSFAVKAKVFLIQFIVSPLDVGFAGISLATATWNYVECFVGISLGFGGAIIHRKKSYEIPTIFFVATSFGNAHCHKANN